MVVEQNSSSEAPQSNKQKTSAKVKGGNKNVRPAWVVSQNSLQESIFSPITEGEGMERVADFVKRMDR